MVASEDRHSTGCTSRKNLLQEQSQNDIIELDKLQKELQDTKYKALSTSSQITEKSRESNVLDMLKNNKDSVLHIATQPPYIINVPEE